MGGILSDQFGRILLLGALCWAGAAGWYSQGSPLSFEEEKQVRKPEAVAVEAVRSEDRPATVEVLFPKGLRDEYRGSERFVFVPEKKVVEFVAIDLQVPEAAIPMAPQVLPSPGPALEGTRKLPRWGEELPPIKLPDNPGK